MNRDHTNAHDGIADHQRAATRATVNTQSADMLAEGPRADVVRVNCRVTEWQPSKELQELAKAALA